jgi:hypothetical protein
MTQGVPRSLRIFTASRAWANDLGTPCVIHQPRYSMFERGVEEGLLDFLQTEGHRFSRLGERIVREADVQRFTLADKMIERAHRFRPRHPLRHSPASLLHV